MMPPPPFSSPLVHHSAVLASALPSIFSHPSVSLDHIYTSRDAYSLWGIGYKPEQKTSIGFVSTYDKNLIQSAGFIMLLILPRSSSSEVW